MSNIKVGDRFRFNPKNIEKGINIYVMGLIYEVKSIKKHPFDDFNLIWLQPINLISAKQIEEDAIKFCKSANITISNSKKGMSAEYIYSAISGGRWGLSRSTESLNTYFIKINNIIYPDE